MWEIWRSRTTISTFPRAGRQDGTQSPVESGTPLGRIASATVNFKDLSIRPEAQAGADGDAANDDDDRHSEDSTNKSAILLKAPKGPDRTKYVIILVGLPGRGKTFLCNKIKCYLNWLGHHTRHFNVGSYRRLQKGDHEVQNADFFDAHNPAGLEARNRALYAALDDLQSYLYSPEGQVAIFDATNTTEERRRLLIRAFHGRFQYLFIESICTDDKVLEQNYRFKMQYSPDYQGMDMQQSLNDFKARIHKYEEVYEPIMDRNIHYIKLIDMVTGRGHMDVNRISGYLPGKIVFFLMQVCKAGMAQARRIWLTRHGMSEFNLKERIGGNSVLAPSGEVYARCLPDMLIERLPQTPDSEDFVPVSVWTSTLCRTIQTARYLPFPKLRWKALDEIQAGACDGMTYEEIEGRFPDEFAARTKDKLRYRYPAGESYLDVIQRLEPVIIEMEREKECIVVVGHQAVLRAVLGYFMAKPLESIPTLEVPLHTLLELRPRPDGTMDFEYIPMPPEAAAAMEETVAIEAAAAAAAGRPPGYGYGYGYGYSAMSSGGSFSGSPSPLLSPMYSMGRMHEVGGVAGAAAGSSPLAMMSSEPPPRRPYPTVVATTTAAPIPIGAAAGAGAAGAATAWSLPAQGGGGGGFVEVAAAGPATEEAGVGPGARAEDVTAAAPPAPSESIGGKHSRSPSLALGIGGSASGTLPVPIHGGTVSPASTPLGASPTSGFLFSVAPAGTSSGTDSPSALSAVASRTAAVMDGSRARPVRVPYGATMGGGGSEGGAPPLDLAAFSGSPAHHGPRGLHLHAEGHPGHGSAPSSCSKLSLEAACSPSTQVGDGLATAANGQSGEPSAVLEGGVPSFTHMLAPANLLLKQLVAGEQDSPRSPAAAGSPRVIGGSEPDPSLA